MRGPVGALLLSLAALALLGTLLAVSSNAEAVGESVQVLERGRHVLEGRSVPIDVFFGADDQATVTVRCDNCTTDERWQRSVRYVEERSNCEFRDGRRVCRISFPEGFRHVDTDEFAGVTGEPAHRSSYTVSVNTGVGNPVRDTFDAWMATAHTCRGGEAWRNDVVMFVTSGHPQGEELTFRVTDLDRNEVVLEQRRTSAGADIPYTFLWEIPLDYPLGNDKVQRIRAEVDSPSMDEQESFFLFQASPTPLLSADPSQDGQPLHFNRTMKVRYWFQLLYLSAPLDCEDISPFRRVVPVEEADLAGDFLRAKVRKRDTAGGLQDTQVESVANLRASYVTPLREFWLNWTIPRDAKATREGVGGAPGSPEYDIELFEHELEDGNIIRPYNSSVFRVHPYQVIPRIETFTEEVERLETAHITFNLTYADGSPLTPNDTSEALVVDLMKVGEDQPVESKDLNHLGDGLWNASFPVGFEYEPLGEYKWVLRPSQDDNGDPNFRNQIVGIESPIFEIIGAGPVIDFRTFVDAEEVNGTQRTKVVHVTLTAVYKNGIPLTSENVDPSLGGVVLNVEKKNRFGRILDVDSLVMTDADDQGTWVRSFRVGRTASQAPVGNWSLEVIAGDDRDPTNRNETSFPFEVRPAQIVVAPTKEPPDLVQDQMIEYGVRLTYPDGSLFTEEMADASRGGDIDVQLHRLTFLNRTQTELTLRPRSVQGGQEWTVSVDPSTLVPGPHFFEIEGQDIHGNQLGPHDGRLFTVLFNGEFRNSTTPICPGEEIDPSRGPQCSLPRGSEVFALYPKSDGDTGMFSQEPIISVLRKLPGDGSGWVLHRSQALIDADEFFEITGQEAGENHVGYFKTDETTPTGTYVIYILGRSADDEGFAGFSEKFNITAVEVDRKVITPLPEFTEKGEQLIAVLQHEPGDVIDDAIVRAGDVTFRNVQVTPAPTVGTFVRWTPPRSAPSGPATIEVDGRDLFGNRFHATLGPVELEASQIRVTVSEPPPVEVPRNSIGRMEARLFFPDGLPYSPSHGEPEVLVYDEGGEQVAVANARFQNNHWLFSWTPPHDTPLEEYHFEVSGRDRVGNIVGPFVSRSFQIVPGTVDAQFPRNPSDIQRGQSAQATLDFPAPIQNVSAEVTTGTESLGDAQFQVDGARLRLAFPTDRTTDLVLARFQVTGTDIYGNELDEQTRLFRINPQRLNIQFLRQPTDFVEKGETVVVDFVIQYPDGTRLRPGQGTPVVGLFARDTPLGPIRANPRASDPTVWRISWEPQDDIRKDIPYRFAVSALDRWQNEALPAQTRGFFVSNPVVPDYLPVPAGGALSLLISLGAAAALLQMRRSWDPPGGSSRSPPDPPPPGR